MIQYRYFTAYIADIDSGIKYFVTTRVASV